ncbi:MAG: hypothetical protein ACI9WU_003620 [Myxococcota bacterium]|jgi:hypothetical protein
MRERANSLAFGFAEVRQLAGILEDIDQAGACDAARPLLAAMEAAGATGGPVDSASTQWRGRAGGARRCADRPAKSGWTAADLHQGGGSCAATRASDVVGRWGGEEFVVLFPATVQYAAAVALEDALNSLAGEEFAAGSDATLQVTGSAGIALFEGADTLDDAIARAAELLYAAQAAGRNRVFVQKLVFKTE